MVFEDNRLVPVLYGNHGGNLKKIEEALHVGIIDRGNELTISGSPLQAEQARTVLEALWGRLQQGHDVAPGDVDAALRFLHEDKKNGNGSHDIEGFSGLNEAAINTRKRKVIARTPLQATYINAMKSKQLVFGLGPAGTGKTYLAVARAVADDGIRQGRTDHPLAPRA